MWKESDHCPEAGGARAEHSWGNGEGRAVIKEAHSKEESHNLESEEEARDDHEHRARMNGHRWITWRGEGKEHQAAYQCMERRGAVMSIWSSTCGPPLETAQLTLKVFSAGRS